jgi:branched-chain amino acid transport system permease protein
MLQTGAEGRRALLTGRNVAIMAAVGVAVVVWVVGGAFLLLNSLVVGAMWSLMAVGLALVFGVMNIPNFAHGEFFMVGAYTAYFVFTPIQQYLAHHPSGLLGAVAPLAGMLASLVVGALLGVVVELLIFYPLRRRTREGWVMSSFILTVGLSVLLVNLALVSLGTGFRGIIQYWNAPSVHVFGVALTVDRLVTFGIALLMTGAFWLFLRRSALGRSIRAVSQDETGAMLVGINRTIVFLVTMAIACAMAALAGSSLLYLFPAYPTVGTQPLYVSWYVVILAGLGNIPGAIVGGFIVALLQTLTSLYLGITWINVAPTALMMLILIFKPTGLFGTAVRGVWEQ